MSEVGSFEGRITRPGVVLPVHVNDVANGLTRARARGKGWRRTSRGFYVPSSVDGSVPEQRIVEAAAVLPAYGGVTGWAALRWLGGAWFDGLAPDGETLLPVDLVTGCQDIRPQPGIEVTHERVRPDQIERHDGLRVTSATFALSFLMRRAVSWREATVMAAMAAYSDLVDTEELALHLATESGWEGIPQARAALPFIDENAWSPWEMRLSLWWQCDVGFPRPLLNVPVFDRTGRHIGTPDLLDPEAGVAGMYDGRLHLEGEQRRKDRHREAAYRSAGLEYFTVMSGDARDRVERLMIDTRRRARWAAASTRAWTIELPPWWIPTFTVAQRRNLSPRDRERLLHLRRRTA